MDQFPLDEMVERAGSRFAVVVAAAQRARQIKDGSPPLVTINSRNPLTIAFAEIAEGKVMILAPAEVEEEPGAGTIDEYLAGREHGLDDTAPYRPPPSEVEAEEAASEDEPAEEDEGEAEQEEDVSEDENE